MPRPIVDTISIAGNATASVVALLGLWILLADALSAQTHSTVPPVTAVAKPAAASIAQGASQAPAVGGAPALATTGPRPGTGEAIVPRLRRIHPAKAAQEAKEIARLAKAPGGKPKTPTAKANSKVVAKKK